MHQRRSTGSSPGDEGRAGPSSPGDEGRAGPSSPDDRESILASSGYALLAQLATVVFTAILTLYLVRALGPASYGTFALAIGVGALVALPADFGISSSTARFVAEHRGEGSRLAAILADAVRLKLIASSIACGALAALAAPIASAYHAPLTWPLRLVAVAVLGQNFMFLFEGAFVAAGRVATNVRVVLGESAVECSTSILLVVLGGGAAGAAGGRAIGYCSGGLLAVALGARSFGWPAAFRRRGRPSSIGRIARYALPLMLVDGANALFSMIDLLLIGAYLGSRQVGLFGAPLRMLTLLTYPGSAVASGVAPRLARAAGQEPDGAALAGGLRVLILLQSLMLAPLVVWAQPIVHLLLGGGYAGSVTTVRVMSLSVYLGGLAPLVSLSANYLGDARSRIPLMISAAIVDGVIDIILIPRIGIVSGAIATAVAYALMVGGHLIICRRHVLLPFMRLWVSAGRGLIAAGAMAALLAAIGTDPGIPILILGTLAGAAVFGLALIAVGEISTRELAQARLWAGARVSALRS